MWRDRHTFGTKETMRQGRTVDIVDPEGGGYKSPTRLPGGGCGGDMAAPGTAGGDGGETV